MLLYPTINPVAFQVGPLAIHWYGLMYLMGFAGCWLLLTMRIRKATHSLCLTAEQLSDVIFYAAIGVIVGGRLGYMLFYGRDDLIAEPLHVFAIWKGGMSFHGGLIGVILAIAIYAYKTNKNMIDITDFIAPAVPIGLALGRIGNFINGELWGRVSDVSWAMVFPNAGPLPRHPSELYEFFLEGIVLFIILWLYSRQLRPRFAVSGLFLFLYGVFRFTIEFFREPDMQMGFVAWGWMTQGQLLCIPMMFLGLGMIIWAYVRKSLCNTI